MKQTSLAIIIPILIALLLPANVFAQAPVIFTGDVVSDFPPVNSPDVGWMDDLPVTSPAPSPPQYDVGMPPGIPPAQYPSGWDIKEIRFVYDGLGDTMYVGYNYFDKDEVIKILGILDHTIIADVIAGDVDNDGDAGRTSSALNDDPANNPIPVDVADLGFGETLVLVIDVDPAPASGPRSGDYIVGVPQFEDINTFRIATFTDGFDLSAPGTAFGDAIPGVTAANAFNPEASRPDFEFSIDNFSQLPRVDFTGVNDCVFTAAYYAFNGSISDGGVGEDAITGDQSIWRELSFSAVRPEVSVEKNQMTSTPIGITAGVNDEVVYTVTISNPGCSELTIVPFTDTFNDDYLQYISSTIGEDPTTVVGDPTTTLTWDDITPELGDIPVGGSVEFEIKFKALQGTPVGGLTTNIGESDGAEDGNGNPAPPDDDGANTVIYDPGIGIIKTAGTAADGAVFYVDGADGFPADVIYHYEIENTGNTDLIKITITDDLGTTLDTGDDETFDKIDCPLLAGPLAPGEKIICDITISVPDGLWPLQNTGVTTGTPSDGETPLDGIDPPTAEDTADVDKRTPGISIIKLAGNAADGTTLTLPQPGVVEYTYKVTVGGDTDLSNITIVDDRGTPDTGDDVPLTNADCDKSLAGPWPPGEVITCTKNIQVNEDTTNIAETSGNPTDGSGNDLPGLDEPTADDDAFVDVFAPGIDLQKTVYEGKDGGASCGTAVEKVTAGQGVDVTYCFLVTNTGDTHLDQVVVTDLTLGDIRLDENAGLIGDAGIVFPLAPQGGQATFYYETTLDAALENEAEVTGNPTDSGGGDLDNYTDPTDKDKAEVEPLFLTLGNRIFRDEGAGANFNNGTMDGDETGIPNVELQLLNGDGSPNGAANVFSDAQGYYKFENLPAGEYKVRVLGSNFGGALSGYASSTDIGSTANPENDTDSDDNGIGAADSGDIESGKIILVYNNEPEGEETASGPDADTYTNFTLDFGFWLQTFDLALRKTPISGSAAPGGDVTFQIEVFNQGTLPATDIMVIDYIPAGTTYKPASLPSGVTDEGGGQFKIASLPARSSVTFPVVITLDGDFQGSDVTNYAEISAATGGTDQDSFPDSSNGNTSGENPAELVDDDIDNSDGGNGIPGIVDEDDHDLATVSVGQDFDLALKKEPAAGQSVSPGENLTFVITVYNQGTLNATNIGVTDYIPVDMSYASSNAASVTLTDNSAAVSISDDGGGTFTINQLGTGDSVSFQVTLLLSVDFTGTSITNYAEIDSATGGTDKDSTPDSSNQNTQGETSGEIVDDDIDSTDGGQGSAEIFDEDDHDLATVAANQFDWGDLPDPDYQTLRANGGPRHIIVSNVQLGATVDSETDGQPNATATGDGADEDGVRFLTPLMPGETAQIEVDASTDGFLNAWFDWNNDGALSTEERVFQDEPLTGGTNSLNVAVPADANASSLYTRFRFTTGETEADEPDGEAPNGEVEDYVLMSIGDTVWLDNGQDTGLPNNGIQDGNEPGVAGVSVELLAGNTVVATTETDDDGNYLFMGLNPGDYTVHIPSSNFVPGGPLAGHISSSSAGDPNAEDTDQNVDENGVDDDAPWTNGISSSTVSLALGNAPFNEDNDANSNLTVDFSFVRFDLALVKRVQSLSQEPLVPGASTVTFEIQVYNQGDVEASSVVVTDYVQNGFSYDQGKNSGWSPGPNPSYTIDGPIPAGDSETITIILDVESGTSGQTVENFAEISDDNQPVNTDIDSTPDANNQEDPVKDDFVDEDAKANPGEDDEDDHDIATTGVAVFDLALLKTVGFAPDPIVAGESKITFEIEVFNQGDTPAHDVVITDYVPDGLTYDPADNPAWTQSETNMPQTTLVGILDGGKSIKVNIVLSVDADVASQPLVNGAEIASADNNDNPDDEPPIDKDSNPNTNPGDDKFVDDEVNDDGTLDEDDHDLAVIEVPGVNLGNIVWNDANDNGVLDVGEEGIEGVTLQLFREGQDPTSAQPVEETTTNEDGEYSFDNLPPGNYFVYIPAPPADYPASSTATDTNDNGQDDDDNGDQPGTGAPTIGPVITLRPGTESETDGDGSNGDLTLDFGFYAPVNIGNTVWHDANNNGLLDDGEEGIPAVVLQLYAAGQTPAVDPPLDTTQTDNDGLYSFDDLSPGEYFVYIPQAPGLYPVSSTPTDENDNQQDHDDNGSQPFNGGPVTSPVIQLTAGGEPDTPVDGDDTNGDQTVDFGFLAPMSLGNLVWHDVNNNGLVDNDEPGISGVTVQLYAAGATPGVDTPIAVEVTNADGLYKFIDLVPGDYFVYIEEPPAGTPTSSTNTDTVDNGEDNDDNGTQPTGSSPVTSPVISLISNQEPTNDGDGPNSDLTLDFGFYRFDLALRKSVASLSETPLVPGLSTVTFDIAVFNQGDTAVSNVEVIDYVQAGFTYDQGANPGWSAGPNPTTTIVGPIEPGASATVQLVLGVAVGTSGSTLENFAEISDDGRLPGTDVDSIPDQSNQEDPVKDDVIDEDAVANPGVDDEDDHDSSTIGVDLFDLALRKRVAATSDTPLIPGQSKITFTIEVFNQGDTPARNVTVVDYVPTGFIYSQGDNPGWSAGPNPTIVIDGPIEPGQSAMIEIVLTLAGDTQGTVLENAAEILDDNSQGADVDSTPDGENSEQPVKDDVIDEDGTGNPGVDDEDDHDIAPLEVGIFDLALRKSLAASETGFVVTGADVMFNVEIFNQGDIAAYDVIVVDYLPAGMTLSPNDENGWTVSDSYLKVVIEGPIEPGQSVSIDLVLRAGDATGAIVNEAEIIESMDINDVIREDIDSVPDDIQGNDPVTDDVIDNSGGDEDDSDIAEVVIEVFDLALQKSLADGQPGSVGVGSDIEFTITVFNQGTIAATNVVIIDHIPVGLSLSPFDDNGWTVDGTEAMNMIPGPILPGGSASINILLSVGEEAAGTVNNIAEIVEAQDENGEPQEDIDSEPDDDPTNDPIVDDEIDDNGSIDEDDHDGTAIIIQGPTAITLSSFAAVANDRGVSLMWSTTMELNTLGFHVYRSTGCSMDNAARITQELVLTQGADGGDYGFEDVSVLGGFTFCYWLQEVELNGAENLYGPVEVSVYGSSLSVPVYLPIISR